jgi:hypothetical protein
MHAKLSWKQRRPEAVYTTIAMKYLANVERKSRGLNIFIFEKIKI